MQQLPDGLSDGLVTGQPVMLVDGYRYVKADGQRLTWVATALVALVIAVSFRSLRWTFIPLCVVQLTLLLTRGLIQTGGTQMTLVSSTISAMITAIVFAAVVHVIFRTRDFRAAGLSPL